MLKKAEHIHLEDTQTVASLLLIAGLSQVYKSYLDFSHLKLLSRYWKTMLELLQNTNLLNQMYSHSRLGYSTSWAIHS